MNDIIGDQSHNTQPPLDQLPTGLKTSAVAEL